MIDKFLKYLGDMIIDYFKNMYNNCRIVRDAGQIETFERGRRKAEYITRYIIS
jgi:hypothetical protein